MDDTHINIKKDFTDHINSIYSEIKFITEEEKDRSLVTAVTSLQVPDVHKTHHNVSADEGNSIVSENFWKIF